jgi:hypothetical protein
LPLRGEAERDAIFRLCDSYIATFSFLSIPYGLHATFSVSNKRKGELIMANMDEVSVHFGLWHCGGKLDRSADCYRRRWLKRGTEHTASERRVDISAIRRIKQCRMT